MNYCPCCSGILLPHIRSSQIHWFCRHCWQEMPVIFASDSSFLPEIFSGKLVEQPCEHTNISPKVYANKRNMFNGWIKIQEMLA